MVARQTTKARPQSSDPPDRAILLTCRRAQARNRQRPIQRLPAPHAHSATDKADGRIKLPPYALAYAKYAPPGDKIYVATSDDSKIITQKETSGQSILDRIPYRRDTLRYTPDNPIFTVVCSSERHRTNQQGG